MKKFLTKILIFILIIAISASAVVGYKVVVIGNQYSGNYQASIIDKVNRLNSIDEPKIILVGNSNLAFGIDSERIEQEIGMPVVNLGLHGGMNNEFNEKVAKQNINEGDLVVVCYTSYSDDGKITDPALAWITIEDNFNLWSLISVQNYPDMIWHYKEYFKDCYDLWKSESGNMYATHSYSRDAFNEYGDVVVRTPGGYAERSTIFNQTSLSVPGINDTCINRLNRFNKYVLSKGADLAVAAYPVAYGEFTPSASEYETFQNELQNKLDFEVISDFTDYFIPYEYFYDTKYHLTDEGVDIRTEQLIKDIKNWKNI